MRLLLGVIGHVDHGKTALVAALTGMQTDRLAEERRRGISIALGFAHMDVPGGVIDFIDMPGHERFVRTMVSGATGLDAVLLVVDAREGIKPQTIEHLDIAALLGIRIAIVAISKIDLVSAAAADARGREVAARVAAFGLTVLGTALTSRNTGAGLAELRALLAAALPARGPARDDGFAYLPIDRAFSIAGHGTVVTGTLRRGALANTDEIEIVPAGVRVRIRGMQVHGSRVSHAAPGQRVAANLRDVSVGAVARGAALATPGLLAAATWLTVALRTVADGPPIENGARLVLLCGTDEVPARLRLLDTEEATPGATFIAQLHATRPVSAPAGERFILRAASPPATLGGGSVIDPAATRLARHVPAALARLRLLADSEPGAIVAGEITTAAGQGVSIGRLAQLAGIAPGRVVAALGAGQTLLKGAGVAVARVALAQAEAEAMAALQAADVPLAVAALGARMPQISAAVLEAATAGLVDSGKLRRVGAALQVPSAARDTAMQHAAHVLAEALRHGGLCPPEPPPGPATRALVARLVRQGVLVRAPDPAQGREIIFHADAVSAARRVLAPRLAPPGLLVREAGAVLGVSRKYSVPLLEYFDAAGFTRRVADRRVLA